MTTEPTSGLTIGTAHVKCPSCDEVLAIPVSGTLITDEEDGRQYLDFKSDMADLWAHSWTHQVEDASE